MILPEKKLIINCMFLSFLYLFKIIFRPGLCRLVLFMRTQKTFRICSGRLIEDDLERNVTLTLTLILTQECLKPPFYPTTSTTNSKIILNKMQVPSP